MNYRTSYPTPKQYIYEGTYDLTDYVGWVNIADGFYFVKQNKVASISNEEPNHIEIREDRSFFIWYEDQIDDDVRADLLPHRLNGPAWIHYGHENDEIYVEYHLHGEQFTKEDYYNQPEVIEYKLKSIMEL